MTKQDYINMAEDYEQQAAVIEKKIKRKKALLKDRAAYPWERKQMEDVLMSLWEMQLECRCSAKRLRKIAEGIRD